MGGKGEGKGEGTGTPDLKAQNEALNSFFSNLIKRGAGNSPRGSPGEGKKGGKGGGGGRGGEGG